MNKYELVIILRQRFNFESKISKKKKKKWFKSIKIISKLKLYTYKFAFEFGLRLFWKHLIISQNQLMKAKNAPSKLYIREIALRFFKIVKMSERYKERIIILILIEGGGGIQNIVGPLVLLNQ